MRGYELILREGILAEQFGGSIEAHGDHAMGFARFSGTGEEFSGHVVDLGSGAGLPALVLADAYPATRWTLIERRTGRAEMLVRAVRRLGFADRVSVFSDDATNAAWGVLRGSADFVTARSFGPPALTAEVGAPLLRAGGSLLTSEPREGSADDRWPVAGLARCGLTIEERWDCESGRYLRLTRSPAELSDLPRRGSKKRPLF